MNRFALAPALLLCCTAALADNAMLVLDASGSMWGKLGDKTKIEIARSAVADLIKTWPANHQLGLVAYGHRRKGDCSDIETLLPYGPLDGKSFQSQVDALNPKGMTPLSAAVIHAADALKSSEQKATVILVSDGEETCDLDPCEVAKKLEDQGINFTAHVVGFDVANGSKAELQLQCIARHTGGQYFNARDAATLSTALDALSDLDKTPPAPAPEALPKATLTAPETVPRGSTLAVQWTGPNAHLDTIVIRSLSDGESSGSVYVENGNPAQLPIPGEVGSYELLYRHRDVETIASRPIQVVEAAVSIAAPVRVPAGTEFEIRWTGPDADLDTIVIARVGDSGYESYAYLRGNNPVFLTAPEEPGAYELRYRLRDSEVIATVAIEVVAQ